MLFYTFGSFRDKKRIFALLAESCSAFLCLYMVTSGVMWIFEKFSVTLCILIISLLIAVFFTAAYLKSSKKGKEFFALSEITINHKIIINRCAVLAAVLLSIGSYSTFGIGYNDGNAQAYALSILNGNTDRTIEIGEYGNIESGSPYEIFFEDSLINIDKKSFTAEYHFTPAEDGTSKDKMWVDFGTNPVYPSLLALSALIFGIKRIALIQAVFAFCLFVFADEILRVLKCDWKLRSALILLLGVSPIVVYCNHTALTEPIIGFCMVMFLYFLICSENKLQMVSVLGMAAFVSLHNGIRTLLPWFLVIYLMYLVRKVYSAKAENFIRTKGQKIFKICCALFCTASVAVIAIRNLGRIKSYTDIFGITLFSFAVCSGVILIPYIMVRLISGKYTVEINEAVIIVSFLYTVLLYSSVMKPSLGGYYYEARFLSSFIPFVILAAGIMLRSFVEERYFIPIIGIVLLLNPYTTALLSSKAENRLDNNILNEVLETAEKKGDENTVILIEKDLLKDFYFPLLNKTEARVYPFEAGHINDFCIDTKDTTSKVLYITNSKGNVYKDKGAISYLSTNRVTEVSDDNLSFVLGLPNGFNEGNSDIVQVIEIKELSEMMDTQSFDSIDMNSLTLSVENVEIDENEKAIITVAVSDKEKMYNNIQNLSLSYHLDYEKSEDAYDNIRILMGSVIIGDFTIEIDLSGLNEGVIIVPDVVEEMKEWYSWNHEVPLICFTEDGDGWVYTIDYKVMGFSQQ